ncbi:MotA/TolQ/ExbB proton channel family protein [Bdellovibrionota bacterium FG-2]
MTDLVEFIRTSFWHVSPIIVAGIFAVAIMIERWKVLFRTYPIPDTESFFDRISEMVETGKIKEAIQVCERFPEKPVAQVTKQALLRAHQTEELIEHGLQLAVSKSAQEIQRRTGFLATVANVATLLGLFGTIAGLINSFQAVGHADAQQKSTLLAAGISQAMNATLLGLGVAIPCMIAFSFLINRTNRLIAEVDQAAVRSLDILKQKMYGVENAAKETLS